MENDTFEWFDPYEQKERAERESRRANAAFNDGRQAVESAISRAARNHLSEKMEMVITALAEKIARAAVYETGALMAQREVADHYGPEMAKLFRAACMKVVHGLEMPETSRVRARINPDPAFAEEVMEIEFETIRPVRVAHRFAL